MKRNILAGVLILALSMLALPVFAVPTQNLAGLANFYPEDTFMYFGFRTDAAFFDEIESLVTRIADATGEDASEFGEGLNEIAQGLTGNPDSTFADTIQPLLGDVGAFGIIDANPLFDDRRSNDLDSGMLFALSITDRAAFQDALMSNETFMGLFTVVEDGDDYVIFGPSEDTENTEQGYMYIGSSVLLYATDMSLFPQAEFSARLSENANFTDTLNMLPAGDYATVGFINPAGMIATFSEMMTEEMGGEVDIFGDMLTSYQESLHGVGLGFTVLDQDNLTMDVSVNADLEAMAESTGMVMPEYGAVDPAFAARVPENAALVFFYPDLGQAISQASEQFSAVMEMQQQMMQEMGADPEDFDEVENQLAAMQFGIQMVTGGTLEESFGWATGQSAFAAGIDYSAFPNGLQGDPTRNPFNLSFVAENVEGGAQQLYDGLTSFLDGVASSADNIVISEKPLVNGEATNISITVDDTPFPIEVQIAVTDSIFAVGTPDYVEAALAGDGGIGATAAFQNAASVSLSDTLAYGYLTFEPIATLMRGMGGSAATDVIGLFESASFSGQVLLPSTTSIRYVISLTPAE